MTTPKPPSETEPLQPASDGDDTSTPSAADAVLGEDVTVSAAAPIAEGAPQIDAGTVEREKKKPVSDGVRPGYLKAGTEEIWVEARGRFDEAGLKGYAPSWDSDQLLIEVPSFEGPLDLLLHLIAKHAMDILDIQVAKITEHYLGVIEDMRKLDLDIAGEFLVMAAKLAHIKSKMLLPKEDEEGDGEPEEDPRAALVRRLLEYQKFKDAAAHLGDQYWLGRDVFTRDVRHRPFREGGVDQDDPLANLETFEVINLVKLFDHISRRNKTRVVHQVVLERLSVGQRINELVDFVRTRDQFTLVDLVEAHGGVIAGKSNIIITFLAVLEMTKFKLLQIHQAAEDGQIYVSPIMENLLADNDIDVDDYATTQDAGQAA